MKTYTSFEELLRVDLRLFDGGTTAPVNSPDTNGADLNVNVTTQASLSAENKTFYDKELIRLAEAELIHDQFGQKRNIPKGGGKTIEFRQFDPLPEMTDPLTEGVTPDGQSMSVAAITATVAQYGGYVSYSDIVDLTTIDPVVLEATKAIASQAGRTLDTIVREVINAGTVVQYCGGVAARASLHYTSKTSNCNLTVDDVKKAVRFLKNQNAPKINGSYVGIIHPNCVYDLMNDPEWKAPHEYVNTDNIYRGEIGMIYGVRFVENTRAKVFEGKGASGADVYSTLIMGDDAYGVTNIEGGGLEHIVKPLGSGGTSDPINQRGTVGWKALLTAKILIPQYLVRVESTATP